MTLDGPHRKAAADKLQIPRYWNKSADRVTNKEVCIAEVAVKA